MDNLMQDERKRLLRGSPARDAFKRWHKDLSGTLYACDADFILVNKYPPGIVAIVDYKRQDDRTTFSEVLAYNAFVSLGIDVFVMQGEPGERLDVYKYVGGDYRPEPPVVELRHEETIHNNVEFENWERALRKQWSKSHIKLWRRMDDAS